jgi:hypothetical protein
MAMYNKQPYHYVMLATTFHPLAYLYEWNYQGNIGCYLFKKNLASSRDLISSWVRLVLA